MVPITIDRILKAILHPSLSFEYLKYKSLGSVTLRSGARIEAFSDFNEYIGTKKNQPTANELSFIESILGDTDVVIDVGANIGVFALGVLCLRPQTRLTCFEPAPFNFNRLRKNLANNGFDTVSLECLALSSTFATKKMAFSADKSSPSTMHFAKINDSNVIEVDVTSLDSYCLTHEIDMIDLLKIDVEGYEVDVLSGARKLLQRNAVKNILIEICPANLARAGSSVQKLWDIWVAMGYVGYQVQDNGQKSVLTLAECERFGCEDIILRPVE